MATIALFGSGEFLPWAREVDAVCIERARASSDRVLVLPTACTLEGEETFQRWGQMGMEHYRGLGLAPELVPLRTREDAFDAEIVSRVPDARLIFFSGGNPGYLAETLTGTPFWEEVRCATAEGTALAGCSAGASAFGVRAPFVVDEELDHWSDGLSLLTEAFVVPHFDALDSYQPGLRSLFLSGRPPGTVALGIDEETAMVGDGERWEVYGAGAAWVAGGDAEAEALAATRGGDRVVQRLGLSLP